MFTHPSEQQEYEKGVLVRRHPEVYNVLIRQGQERQWNVAQSPNALDQLIGRIKRFFRRKQ